ncbi:uncharacterized protein LOC114258864 [Camellia sinensis]|uniref:uncharacterized protein LOC114258864 n=1 Tax=Camellia sinensis TaxID=4442 RepID=UPI0010358253|nr:uncharacterized protein LOC114258864 [Camellia sinensis]
MSDDSDRKDIHDPFVQHIAKATFLKKFKAPSFILYDRKSNPIDHVRHYKQVMTLHADDEVLMCRIFPNSLRSLVVKWYYRLEPGLVGSFHQLQKSFKARFIMNEIQPKQEDSLWAMKIKQRKALREYSARYWECFNLVDDECNYVMTITTFKMELHRDSSLRSSLTRRPPKMVWSLMRKVKEYCKVEDDAIRVKASLQAEQTTVSVMAQPSNSVPLERTSLRKSPDTRGRFKKENH